jgi:hypothetical protein
LHLPLSLIGRKSIVLAILFQNYLQTPLSFLCPGTSALTQLIVTNLSPGLSLILQLLFSNEIIMTNNNDDNNNKPISFFLKRQVRACYFFFLKLPSSLLPK